MVGRRVEVGGGVGLVGDRYEGVGRRGEVENFGVERR